MRIVAVLSIFALVLALVSSAPEDGESNRSLLALKKAKQALAAARKGHASGNDAPLNKTVTFYWDGNDPSCQSCGGTFACSNGMGNWSNGLKTFPDNGPAYKDGWRVTGVVAVLTGSYSCRRGAVDTLRVQLNGMLVDEYRVQGDSQCTCGTCDGERTFVNEIYEAGWPGYNYSGSNSIQVVPGPVEWLCLSRLDLTLTYSMPVSQYSYQSLQLGGGSDSCAVCGAPGAYQCVPSGQNISIPFQDPIPQGAVVTFVYAMVYGQYSCQLTQQLDLTVLLTGQQVGAASRPVCNISANLCPSDCYGGVLFVGSDETGWPTYAYGGTNVVAVALGDGTSSANLCVGSVELVLEYYHFGK